MEILKCFFQWFSGFFGVVGFLEREVGVVHVCWGLFGNPKKTHEKIQIEKRKKRKKKKKEKKKKKK